MKVDVRRVQPLGVAFLVLLGVMAFPSPMRAEERPAATVSAAAVAAVLEGFEAEIARDVHTDGIGGMTAAVLKGNALLWIKGFGWADVENQVPAGPDTIYRIGSISKTITATVLMHLVERGVVSLHDPVVRHFPEFTRLYGPADDVRSVSLLQLASHMGGLVREPLLSNAAAGPLDQWEAQVLASVPHAGLQSAPGTHYAYSNIGFGILGLALSRAADVPFMHLVRTSVFDPLGMHDSGFAVAPAAQKRLAVGYLNHFDGTVDAEHPLREHGGRGYKVPNGGVYATAGDLGRFLAGISGASERPFLTAESRKLLRTEQTPDDAPRKYGVGLILGTAEGDVAVAGHGGAVAGYSAQAAFNPETRFAVVLLRNYNQGQTNLQDAAARVLGQLVRATRP